MGGLELLQLGAGREDAAPGSPERVLGDEDRRAPVERDGDRVARPGVDLVDGGVLLVEMFGLADAPYLLFAGSPSPTCTRLPWLLGEVAMTEPVFLVAGGIVPATGLPNQCGLEIAITKIEIPDSVMPGARMR